MEFKDKDGKPLLPFHDSKSAFEHWRSTTKGRPCDYTGMSYDKLTGGSGMQWPCNAETSPNGTERLVSWKRQMSPFIYLRLRHFCYTSIPMASS